MKGTGRSAYIVWIGGVTVVLWTDMKITVRPWLIKLRIVNSQPGDNWVRVPTDVNWDHGDNIC